MQFKKRLLCILLSISITISLLPVSVLTAYALDAGDVISMEDITDADAPSSVNEDGKDWYEISTLRELMWFAKQVNSGNCAINARLTNDIDLSAYCHQAGKKLYGADMGAYRQHGLLLHRYL